MDGLDYGLLALLALGVATLLYAKYLDRDKTNHNNGPKVHPR